MLKKAVYSFVLMLFAAIFLFPASALARDDLKNTDPDKYYILLDTKNQIVTVYERDENGEYKNIVRRFTCTSGRTELDPEDPEDKGTPTPTGVWKIGGRERFGKFIAFSGEYARYWTQIVDGAYFHSVLFGGRDVNKLKSGAFSNLGNKGSHGCVRLYVEDAKWLYYYACPGTTIKVSNSEKSNGSLTTKLRTKMKFSEYNAFQKLIYDGLELPNNIAYVTVDNASLRTGHGGDDGVIMRLAKDTELEVLQDGDPWLKVKVKNREGYIKLAYVTYEKGVMQSKSDATIVKTTDWLYETPDRSSKKITKIPHDVSLNILEETGNGWIKVRYWTKEGYFQTRYTTKGWGAIVN